jgi:hypothetical protein
MHSWISSSIIQNSGLLSHRFSVFVVIVRSPTTKLSQNVHILSSRAYLKQPTSHFHTQKNSGQMLKFFHTRPPQNNPLPISTPKLQNSAQMLNFFHTRSTQNNPLNPLPISTPKLQNATQMLKLFHPRLTQNIPLLICTPQLQISATILQFFHPLPTQNSLRPLACWYLGSNPTGGMDVSLLWVLCVVR